MKERAMLRTGPMAFCATENDIRHWMRNPWLEAGKVTATNGHILIAYDSAPHGIEIAERTEFHPKKVANLIASSMSGELADIPALPEPANCPSCDGAGKIDWCWDKDWDGNEYKRRLPNGEKETCFQCDGYGEGLVVLAVGNAFYQVMYLRLLQTLPDLKFYANGMDKPARFTFDGGFGMLMPCREK